MDVIALVVILLLVLGLQSFLLCRYAFSRLEYKCEFSVPEAYEGDSIYLIETVYNRKLLPVPWMKVDIHSSRWLDFAGTCSVIAQDNRRVTSSFTLRGYQRTVRKWKLECLKRGVFTTENVTLISGDLLNFNNVSMPVPVNASLTVFPEIIDLEELFVPIDLRQSDRTVQRWIIDDPFMVAGAREYVPGDPVRGIHWPATARTGRLMVRKNEFTSQRSLTILLNMQSQLYEYADTVNKEAAELAIKVAATLLDQASGEGIPVRLGTNGCVIAEARESIFTGEAADKDHILGLLRILSSLVMHNAEDFEMFLDSVMPTLRGTEVVIVTAYASGRICEQADLLAEEGNTVTVLILDDAFEKGIRPEKASVMILTKK